MQLVSELYRKHRLIEVFLVNHLGYTTNEIHEEAEVLEHTVSDRFVERLDKMLNFPATCPHGGTIPSKGELLIEKNTLTLETAKKAGDYVLRRVHDDFELLKYLEKHGLKIGDVVTLVQYDPYAQIYILAVKGQELQISPMIAQQIYVEKI